MGNRKDEDLLQKTRSNLREYFQIEIPPENILNDPNTVHINEYKAIEVLGNQTSKLYTYGLISCNVQLIYAKKGETQHGTLLHYAMSCLNQNLNAIEQVAKNYQNIIKAEQKSTVILYPGPNYFNLWHKYVDSVESKIKSTFGQQMQIQKVPYSHYPLYRTNKFNDVYLCLGPKEPLWNISIITIDPTGTIIKPTNKPKTLFNYK